MRKDAKNHLGHFERIRKKIITGNPYDYEEIDVVEMLLQGVFVRADTNEIARFLLAKYRTFQNLYEKATEQELLKIPGFGLTSARKLLALLKLFKYARLAPSAVTISTNKENFNDLVKHVRNQFEFVEKECFVVLILNRQHEVIETKLVAVGDTNHVVPDLNEIVELAHTFKSTNLIFAHNHLNSSFYPSTEDIEFTSRAIVHLRKNGIDLLDHLIITNAGYFSFSASHLMNRIIARLKNPALRNMKWDGN